jgi:hypothetical protein
MTSKKAIGALWLGATGLMFVTFVATPQAGAKAMLERQTQISSAPVQPLPTGELVADNVVVTPGSQAPASTPPAQTVVVPQATQPAVQAAPVVAQPANTSHREVKAEVSSNHNYMSTIAVSAFMGAVAGVLVGGAIYYLGDSNNREWRNVAYWAAGGVLVGTGVGIVQLIVQENRVSNATALNRFPSDPAPTYRLALLRVGF